MLGGQIAALTAAFLWALSTVLFGRLGKSLRPLPLNLAKGLIASVLIAATLLVQADIQPELPTNAVFWLLLSGAVGIGLGDTAYFTALNLMGARRVLLMESLAPALTALLALLFLKEQLAWTAWVGILLTLVGVAWVISERVPDATGVPMQPWQGAFWGILAALGQASGSVMSRGALANTTVDPLWSSLLRITAGAIVLLALFSTQRHKIAQLRPLKSRNILLLVILAAIMATYLGIWLQQVSFKYTPAGIAQALLATSPLFVIPIAVLMGDRVTWRAILGVLIAIAGIWLLISST
ncbi:MAG: DMT family transporter [Cyanobacteria bacterium J06638_28]